MPDKLSMNPVSTKDFMRISAYSVKKLQSVKGLPQFSKIRLKNLQDKIKDLRSSSLKARDRQELMFEISREIGSLENSSDVIKPEYLSFFSSFVSNYRKQFPELFEAPNPLINVMNDYSGKFDLIQKLESTEECQKWKVRNRDTKQDSVLTIYPTGDKALPDGFQGSFASWSRLDHRNILKLKEVYHFSRSLGIETEMVSGESLSKAAVPMKPEEALYVAYQIAQGLEYAHSKNVFHLVLSPDDVLVAGSGTLKLSGWNQCFLLKDAKSAQESNFNVNMEFSAPEVLSHMDYRPMGASDIYSLSAITVSLLLGGSLSHFRSTMPFNEKRPETLIEKLPVVRDDLKTLLKSGLSPDPKDRISATQFISTLSGILGLQRITENQNSTEDNRGLSDQSASLSQNAGQRKSADSPENVTRIEISLVGSKQSGQSKEPVEDSQANAMKSIAVELQKQLKAEKYETILLTLKNRESQIVSRFPELKEAIGTAKSNLSAIIKFPMVPKEEINSRILDLINTLENP